MADISTGRLFRCVNKTGSVWGNGITERSYGALSESLQRGQASTNWLPTTSDVPAPDSATWRVEGLDHGFAQ